MSDREEEGLERLHYGLAMRVMNRLSHMLLNEAGIHRAMGDRDTGDRLAEISLSIANAKIALALIAPADESDADETSTESASEAEEDGTIPDDAHSGCVVC